MQREVDVIVVGGGPVGENAADRARAAGLEVVLVERELVGGECSYWACIPSKTLLRSAAALRAVQRVGGAREAVTGGLDVPAVLARRDYWVSDWSDQGGADWLESIGIGLERGHGRLDGARRVVVERTGGGEIVYLARHAVVVATGSDPVVPPIAGLAEARPWTSREATSVTEPPARLAIIGGGVVAVEMATAYAGFGTEVMVLARSGLLGGMEPFAGEAVAAGLRGLGASVRLGVQPTLVERRESGEVVITLDDGGSITADEVLVATGRKPRTERLGLETIGLEPGGWVDVDDTMLVTGAAGNDDRPWLYAVGDLNHRALLTHQGKYQARAAGDLIAARALGRPEQTNPWGAHVATADHSAVPQVVFAEPEAVSVGLTVAAAERAGLHVRAADVAFSSVSGAGILADDYEGRARLVVDEERGTVVGATFVGQDVAELLQSATIAIVGEVPIDRLWHAVPAFPTMSEVWLRLLEALGRPAAKDASEPESEEAA
ncbi:pyridine nucleotide-disulfide oxidoreductase [Agromyces badenianii]|uniref:Pyridine nucleotide-disulfide oxidoreductase n=1 Tax=Agromyces badenianii TaxID=2080742 RepID=A0A2S0WUR5_9MICO|nr:NAD(P)/FAD-dependent oxidoreductase [Agromyces badenianii]AWB95040.1 pyridine nucleotide-disulfide oxidoreductase [Agromyces badenianii]